MSKRAEEFQNNHKQLYEVDYYSIEVVKELERNAYIAGEKETIERAVAWLATKLLREHCLFECEVDDISQEFKKAIEEEQ